MMDTSEYRAEFVRDFRQELNVNQREFGQIVGVTTAMVSRWENAQSSPSNSTWEKLYDFRDEYFDSSDPERFVELVRLSASIIGEESPLELVLTGRLETRLREQIKRLGLHRDDPRVDMVF